MTSQIVRAYVLVELFPGKEKEFCEEIINKGLIFSHWLDQHFVLWGIGE